MHAIEIKDLRKDFGGTAAVDGISFSVEPGEVFGFLGPNGAGKTTTIRCLMDFIRPTAGSISIAGLDAQAEAAEVKKKVGYLSPDVPLYAGWTGERHLRLVCRLRGVGLDNAAKNARRLGLDLSKRAHDLSSGNKQKLGVVMALLGDPEVLVMDEPTSALDPLLQNTVYDLLAERGRVGATVFLSSHNLPEVERICGRVAIIRKGKLAAVEKIEDLRSKQFHLVEARLDTDAEAKEFDLPDVEVVRIQGNRISLKAGGGFTPVLKVLAKHKVEDLEVTRASLEEIFLAYYKDER